MEDCIKKSALLRGLLAGAGEAVLGIWCFANVSQPWRGGQSLPRKINGYCWKHGNKVGLFNNRIVPLCLRGGLRGRCAEVVAPGRAACAALLRGALGVPGTWSQPG